MRVVVQRVKHASVEVDNKLVSHIDRGLLVFLGISHTDTEKEADYLAKKIAGLRIFEDEQNKMNLSLADLQYEMMVISQFTLYGNCQKGRRPSFTGAMAPDKAEQLYEYFIDLIRNNSIRVKKGVFGAHMNISLLNDGPVTFIIDSI